MNRSQPGKKGNRWLAWLLDLLYPPACAFCGRCLPRGAPATGICPSCRENLPYTGPTGVSRQGTCFQICRSPLFYQDRVAESIRKYKFQGQACYHFAYGILLRECLRQYQPQAPDLITWVPLSAWRRWRRGYDQAYLLAREAAQAYGMEPVRLLKKIRNTRPQSSLSHRARKGNVRGVYRMADGAPAVEGKRILVVDDVITTGSTLSACAAVLLADGAEEVDGLTLARTWSEQTEP